MGVLVSIDAWDTRLKIEKHCVDLRVAGQVLAAGVGDFVPYETSGLDLTPYQTRILSDWPHAWGQTSFRALTNADTIICHRRQPAGTSIRTPAMQPFLGSRRLTPTPTPLLVDVDVRGKLCDWGLLIISVMVYSRTIFCSGTNRIQSRKNEPPVV
ncbi:hypothetical protein LIA77_10345 [Sarocladium implicatum]|nr:hypothetical protein LIA77_10345 [Sarocladium implicatum]